MQSFNPLYLRRAPNHSLKASLKSWQCLAKTKIPKDTRAFTMPIPDQKKATSGEPSPESSQPDMQSTKRRCSLLFLNPSGFFYSQFK